MTGKLGWRRRTFLLGLGSAAGQLGALQQRRQGRGSRFADRLKELFVTTDNSGFHPTSHSFEDSDLCVVSARAVEGPYFVDDPKLVRSDIREDREGVPLELGLRIVDAETCRPGGGAAVDIWHCDALGFYSHYTAFDPNKWPSGGRRPEPTDNETFLRGSQVADKDETVRFQTVQQGGGLRQGGSRARTTHCWCGGGWGQTRSSRRVWRRYPGWYTPRVQHIHARVVLAEQVVATVQLYFPEELNRRVALQPPYDQRPPSPYTNSNDFVLSQSRGGDGSWLKMTETANGYRGTLTVGIRV